jgi:hypothetical protein
MGTERHRPRWLDFLLGSSGRQAADYVHSHGRKVAEVMTKQVQAVSEDTSVNEIVDLMEHFHIKRLPVLRDGTLVGIVGRADLLHALVALPHWGPSVGDADPSASTSEIAKQPRGAPGRHKRDCPERRRALSGMVLTKRANAVLFRVLAENTPCEGRGG